MGRKTIRCGGGGGGGISPQIKKNKGGLAGDVNPTKLRIKTNKKITIIKKKKKQ
jgi:hypothetical protein